MRSGEGYSAHHRGASGDDAVLPPQAGVAIVERDVETKPQSWALIGGRFACGNERRMSAGVQVVNYTLQV